MLVRGLWFRGVLPPKLSASIISCEFFTVFKILIVVLSLDTFWGFLQEVNMLKPRVKTNISRKLDCFPCVHLEFWPRTWWTVMEPFFCFKMIESFGMISQQTSWLNLNFRCEEILLSNDLLNKRLFKQGQFSIKSVPHVCFFLMLKAYTIPGTFLEFFSKIRVDSFWKKWRGEEKCWSNTFCWLNDANIYFDIR